MAKVVHKKVRKPAVPKKSKTGVKSHVKLQKKGVTKEQSSSKVTRKNASNKESSKLDDEINNLKNMIAKVKADLTKIHQKPSENEANQKMSRRVKCLEENYKNLRTAANDRAKQIEKLKCKDDRLTEVLQRKESAIEVYTARNNDYISQMRECDVDKKKIQKKCEELHAFFKKEIQRYKDMSRKETTEWKNYLTKIDNFRALIQSREKPIQSLIDMKKTVEEVIEDIHTRQVCENTNSEFERKIDAAVDLAMREGGGFRCN